MENLMRIHDPKLPPYCPKCQGMCVIKSEGGIFIPCDKCNGKGVVDG
jgi:hypothetical protein